MNAKKGTCNDDRFGSDWTRSHTQSVGKPNDAWKTRKVSPGPNGAVSFRDVSGDLKPCESTFTFEGPWTERAQTVPA